MSQTPESNALPPILLVEDSATTATVLSRYLSGQYRIVHARDGEEAWQLLGAQPDVELVITDIQMPRLTGHQLLVKIRTCDKPAIRALPVIVMTSADDNVDRNLAFLNGASDFVTKPIDELEIQARVKVHHTLTRTIHELEASRQQLTEQATTDPLTHLRNRRAFFDNGDKALALARRHNQELSVVLADIDYFKRINDSFGHHVGDEALLAVSQVLRGVTREADTLARLGGEEFALLMPDTNRLGAAVLAERLRAAVEHEKFLAGNAIVPLTISVGIATLNADQAENIGQLLSIADRRLYLAKHNGRNRICVNDEGKSSFAV